MFSILLACISLCFLYFISRKGITNFELLIVIIASYLTGIFGAMANIFG